MLSMLVGFYSRVGLYWSGYNIFPTQFLSLELDFECRIPKFCHSWNLLGIMWNSGISLEVDYILPNLTYLVSIWPNVIILYPFGVSLNFWSLDLGDPKILQSPEFGSFSMWGIFPLSFCQGPWFSMQNSKIPSFLESSKNFTGDCLFFKQYQGLEYFSHSNFSLEFDYECSIQKFHHNWNFPGIIWNSGISLDIAYFLPNLTYLVSI